MAVYFLTHFFSKLSVLIRSRMSIYFLIIFHVGPLFKCARLFDLLIGNQENFLCITNSLFGHGMVWYGSIFIYRMYPANSCSFRWPMFWPHPAVTYTFPPSAIITLATSSVYIEIYIDPIYLLYEFSKGNTCITTTLLACRMAIAFYVHATYCF